VISDKRKARRIPEKAPAAIRPSFFDDTQADKKITHCLTEDISIRGMKIQSESFFPMNSTLRIQLSLKERARAINVVGKIRWIRKLKVSELYEMGIEIVETSRKDQSALERHIEDSPQTIKEERRPWKPNLRSV
jgi:c-di-GMP-binding flagellar brake protein YcgR